MSAKDYTLAVEPRSELGSTAVQRLRSQGKLPAVVYSKHSGNSPISLSYREFINLASNARISQVITFKSEDKDLDGISVIAKQMHRNFLKESVLHVDFQALKSDESVTVTVPLEIKGEAHGVKNEGGILTVSTDNIEVSCIPRKIPSSLIVDVTELTLGHSISAQDIDLPEGVELESNPDETIVSVVTARLSLEPATTEEAGEAEEGEAAADSEEGAAEAKTKEEGEEKPSKD